MFRATVLATTVIKRHRIFGLVINRVAKITDFGHKWGKGFRKWAAHPTQLFWEFPRQGMLRELH